jgi:hypothetical protein
VLSKLLFATGIVLMLLKFGLPKIASLRWFGLRARLKDLGRAIDRFVNIALVVIVVGYVAQLAYIYFYKR